MHTVRHVVQRLHVVHATPTATAYEVAQRMADSRVGCVPVLDGERLVGVFSERDLMSRVVVAGRDPKRTPLETVMTRDVVTASLDDDVDGCLDKMRRSGCRHMPVVHEDRVVAMLSMRDLLRDEIEVQSEEIRGLRQYIQQA